MTIPSFSCPSIRANQTPSTSLNVNNPNALRFGSESSQTPNWQADGEQLVEWLDQQYNSGKSPFAQFYENLSGLFSQEFNPWDQLLHPGSEITRHPLVSDEPPVPDNFLDPRTNEGQNFFKTVQDMMSMEPGNAEQHHNRLIYLSKTAVPEVIQAVYEGKGASSSNLLAVCYFRAAVTESDGTWRIVNPEALTKAFQWDTVARRNGQKMQSIFESKGSNPADERKAIMALLQPDEKTAIQEAEKVWLKKFPPTA